MRAGVVAGVLALAGLARGEAQSPEERRQVDALRDTLGLVTDTMALRERESLVLQAALRSRDQPFYHLYLGTLALRQGELGGVAHFDESAAEFRWATRLAPGWTYAWVGAGTAEFGLGDRLVVAAGEDRRRHELAREAYRRGALALARAVSLEPAVAARLVPMARRAMRAGFPEQAGAVRDALQQAASDRGGAVLLALGRAQRLVGDTGSLRSFTKYLASSEHRPLGLVELGRTQLLRGDLSGALRYLAAASEADSLALHELRADLEPLATEAELQEFDRRTGTRRLDFLRRFWSGRDRLALRNDGERLAEHLRRLTVAWRDFLVIDPDGTERLDDRGRVYLRHGEPDERVSYAVPGIEPNESWCYRGLDHDSDLVLHFAARRSVQDFDLIESLQDLGDGRWPRPAVPRPDPALFRSRSSIDAMYREIPEGKKPLESYLSRERALGRRGMETATRFDSYRLGFAPVPGAWSDVVVAGSTAASPVVQIGFSLPPASKDSVGPPGQAGVRLRFVALDTLGNVLAAVDSVIGEGKQPGGGLAGVVALRVRPGLLVVHGAIQTNATEGLDAGIDTLRVPAPGGRELALGSLLLGSDTTGVPVRMSDGAEFRLGGEDSAPVNGEVRLALEVFGLTPEVGAKVRVLMASAKRPQSWRPWPHRSSQAMLVRAPGSGPVVSWRAELPTRSLRPGEWRVAVEVTANGRVVRREARFSIRGP